MKDTGMVFLIGVTAIVGTLVGVGVFLLGVGFGVEYGTDGKVIQIASKEDEEE